MPSLTTPGFRIVLPRGLSLGGQPVLGALDLAVPGGRTTALLGPSGSGKSTLLRLVAGLLPVPAGGSVQAEDGAALAGRVAYMAQQDLLAPWRDVLGNITLGAHLRGEAPDLARARAMLAEVGLVPADQGKSPAQLSGGMRQRVALARTLMEDRPLVLMDEPFSAVDAPTRHRMQSLSARLLAGRTVLLVTHDPLEALRLADQIFVLTGAPAVPVAVPVPTGAPPRPAGDPALLEAQAALLERLAEAVA
ncbi:ABC transporter ATP-binding protein [Roseomonas frigidaquae]|uniref:ABC transporter ATP-binding protein n=1 Tax=Falsiroseomonas frigidaquae TaxID=487318 RepID=A0ABX1F3U2_9PROT|nr:ABC transporter ATP-binding protein [Falsiroseomonas frigidaquae]NKE47019.1 ABC transporter ATP-binding protein [Falsiroseomonas frigidaquae]